MCIELMHVILPVFACISIRIFILPVQSTAATKAEKKKDGHT